MRSSRPRSARLASVIVVGILGARGRPGEWAVEIARRAAASGARVEMVGVAPPDLEGDEQLIELAGAGIGHATVVRSFADGLEAADLDLALHYLPDIRAIVLVQPGPAVIPPATAAATWSDAGFVVVGPVDRDAVAALDAATPSAIVLDPPATDPDRTFAGFVAALAVRLDLGEAPSAAWSSTVDALAVDPVSGKA